MRKGKRGASGGPIRALWGQLADSQAGGPSFLAFSSGKHQSGRAQVNDTMMSTRIHTQPYGKSVSQSVGEGHEPLGRGNLPCRDEWGSSISELDKCGQGTPPIA